jgi:DNA-binding response OmpR family regulator
MSRRRDLRRHRTPIRPSEMALRDHGYSVLRATRGHTGYHVAVTEKPEVIITDLAVPDVDGGAACAWLACSSLFASADCRLT